MTETRRGSAVGTTPAAPFKDMQWPMPWTALGAASSAMEPLARNAARCNLELSSLVGQRVQAYSRVPEALSRCRTPFDLLQAQMSFWQEAGGHYVGAAQRLAQVWQSALTAPFGGMEAGGADEERDYITFPEEKSDVPTDDRRYPGTGRRAA